MGGIVSNLFLYIRSLLYFKILAAGDTKAIKIIDHTIWYGDSAKISMLIIPRIAIRPPKANGSRMEGGNIKRTLDISISRIAKNCDCKSDLFNDLLDTKSFQR